MGEPLKLKYHSILLCGTNIFYHAMYHTSKQTVDVALGEAFKRKNVEEATKLIEELAKSNYIAPSEAAGSSGRSK